MAQNENNAPRDEPAGGAGPVLGFAAAVRVAISLDEDETHEGGAAAAECVDLRIPPYSIERKVGEGAGGAVYRAFREGSDRAVALKVLARGLGTGPEARRAWRELSILSDLHLASLPRVIDHGVHEGRLFIATEFVEGTSLTEHARAEHMDGRQRVEMLARVCDAVQELHEHGVIHRDLKPSNILIDARGHVFLIDFGIAALMEEFGGGPAATLTEEGRPIGTPAFMSPEQARGERRRTGTRSDVYSLGAAGYVLLTGHTPHDTDTTIHEAVRRVAEDEPREARRLAPGLSRGLAAVLEKAVSREPSRRYASAAALGADLRRWLAGEAVEAQPPGAWRKALRWIAKHPIASTAAACAAVVVLTIAGTFVSVWWLSFRPWQVVMDPDGKEARLLALNGNVLKTWGTGLARGVAFAEMLSRPESLGGGRVIMTVAAPGPRNDPTRYSLSVWSLSRGLDEPEWVAVEQGEQIAPPFLQTPGLELAPGAAIIADVFPDEEHPGKEIVCTFNQHVAPSVMIVYDLSGTVLFQAWHRGMLGAPYWIPDAGLIVFHGLDNRFRVLREDDTAELEGLYPRVVGAVMPRPGGRLGVLNRENLTQPEAEWYLWLHIDPGAQVCWGSFRFAQTRVGVDAHRSVELILTCPDETGLSWIFNADGSVGKRLIADATKEVLGPDIQQQYRWIPRPPEHVRRAPLNIATRRVEQE